MKKPIVGISGSELTKNVGPFVGYRRSYVNKDYSEAVIKNGGVPMIIPFNEDADVTESQLELVDALILSGGQDIDSESYGEEPQPEQGTVWQARDQFDMRLLKLAEKRGIPVLGICRGVQLINVFHGGSLYQDLKYYPVPTLKHWQGDTPWWQATHQVKLVKDTHLAAIFDQAPRLRVNSYHHQLIKKVGKGLKVNALAQDGVYEGIENETGTVLGVQWHPEMLRAHQAEMNRLFDYLIKCANGKGRDEHAE